MENRYMKHSKGRKKLHNHFRRQWP